MFAQSYPLLHTLCGKLGYFMANFRHFPAYFCNFGQI